MAQDGDEPTKEEVWVWATKVQQKQDETQVLKLLQAGVKSNSCKKEMMNCQIRRVLAIKKKGSRRITSSTITQVKMWRKLLSRPPMLISGFPKIPKYPHFCTQDTLVETKSQKTKISSSR
ncbi:hypothetical protein QL285_061853 [Trifolium repens]|nr:hypothetical protein QL285_061853 [Trifolium repens]